LALVHQRQTIVAPFRFQRARLGLEHGSCDRRRILELQLKLLIDADFEFLGEIGVDAEGHGPGCAAFEAFIAQAPVRDPPQPTVHTIELNTTLRIFQRYRGLLLRAGVQTVWGIGFVFTRLAIPTHCHQREKDWQESAS
jgi:hypothetical protein